MDDSWRVTEPVMGGPINGSIIPSFLGHVASRMDVGIFRDVLRLQSRSKLCQRLQTLIEELPPQARRLITASGLSHLPVTMHTSIDAPLISAFVERWQPDTNTFHMPFGEMTIMLHDVERILRIPVEGQMVSRETELEDLLVYCSFTFQGCSMEEVMGKHYSRGGILNESILECISPTSPPEESARAWLWLMLGSTLFVDKSGNRCRPNCLTELWDDMDSIPDYSWSSATLAYLFRQLGIASRGSSQGLSGCLTVLQTWIYEYFPCLRPHSEPMITDSTVPRASVWSICPQERSTDRLHNIRARLDRLTSAEVAWLPFGHDPCSLVPRTSYAGLIRYRDIEEPYMPQRVLRQLGFVQRIPSPIILPNTAIRSWEWIHYKVDHGRVGSQNQWESFPDMHQIPIHRYIRATTDPSAADEGYMQWFVPHSHPQLLQESTGEGDGPPIPPRSSSQYVSDVTLYLFI